MEHGIVPATSPVPSIVAPAGRALRSGLIIPSVSVPHATIGDTGAPADDPSSLNALRATLRLVRSSYLRSPGAAQ